MLSRSILFRVKAAPSNNNNTRWLSTASNSYNSGGSNSTPRREQPNNNNSNWSQQQRYGGNSNNNNPSYQRGGGGGSYGNQTSSSSSYSRNTTNFPRLLKVDYPVPKVIGKEVNGFVLRNDPTFRIKFESKPGPDPAAPVSFKSPWHDIPLYCVRDPVSSDPADKSLYVNMVCEIPFNTTDKMEIATKEDHNPIKQDIKKEKLRQYPFSSLVNYGALPQTWEDPDHVDPNTKLKGDNDPLDVVEIGYRVARMGEAYRVKVLGVLGMIDEGEMDWKIVAISAYDQRAPLLNSVADLEAIFPGKIASIVKWFKMYKVPDGKPENSFAFDDKMMDVEFARKVIADCHEAWKKKDAMKSKGLWVGA
jgi:inorganic pyrophosphatase